LLELLAKVYMRMIGTVTYTPNLAISRIPLEVPRDDMVSFLSPRSTVFETGQSINKEENLSEPIAITKHKQR